MVTVSRRTFLGITATGLGALWLENGWPLDTDSASAPSGLEALYKAFQDPDRKYSIRPFWFWNGKLDSKELDRQIRLMVEHGVYGAYVHNRDGLETPYLSEEWWQAVGAALKSARQAGFSLCMVDEFEWPSGEARDYWLPGINKSRVVAANPEFRIRQLKATETQVQGPRLFETALTASTTVAVAGRLLGPGRIDGESLRVLPFEPNARTLSWQARTGQWLVITYALEPSQTPDGGTVDLMNPDAVRKFIELYYEEFYRRYGEYFGNALPATFADHEGSYGGIIGWTPRLFEAFRRKAGYDLESHLPALVYDIGPKTEKVRCDYLDVVSELYSDSFFKQVTDWCKAHNIEHSGHVWEESLFFNPWAQGDFFRILRAMSNPGCDSLREWARESVWLKEVASVADFEGRRLVCENQGEQGYESYLSPERMRRVSNCLGAWNVSEFIPHAFDYDLNRINYPPDWFESQPFLPYFRPYADQMRRISFMNWDSHHVADILLYYPQVSVWGQGAPAFRGQSFDNIIDAATWSVDAAQTQSQYTELKLRLSENRLDYKVADDSYIAQSRVEGKTLVISNSHFSTLVLPPMSTIRRATAERMRDFYHAGGTVIAIGRLPLISTEEGREDAQLKSLWDSVFDTSPSLNPYTLRSNDLGGRAYFLPASAPNLVDLLLQISDPDLKVVDGPVDHLYFLHKKKEGVDFYWVVNDSAEPRTNLLRLHARGRRNAGTLSPASGKASSTRRMANIRSCGWRSAPGTRPTSSSIPRALCNLSNSAQQTLTIW